MVQVRRQDHEAEIGPGQHGKGYHGGLLLRARGFDQLVEIGECGRSFGRRAASPCGEVDPIEKMERAETFGGLERLDGKGAGNGCVFGMHLATIEEISVGETP
jgi:hypothetical protein